MADEQVQTTIADPFAAPAAIELAGVSKAYRLYASPVDRLKEALNPFGRGYHKDFFALKDLNLRVPFGATYGLVGLNGSGKSTLLKIVCGVTTPTTGEVRVQGRVSALLELGAGFNPEFTGRQNVFFSGALAGFDRAEMQLRFPEIEAFADIGQYLDQPVKSYSSGMLVRLAFAVAIHVDPDILVIDEALAVGDARFQHKCLTRIEAFKGKATILFVSHDMGAVTAFCDQAVWLHAGKVRQQGAPGEVVKSYIAATYEGVAEDETAEEAAAETSAEHEALARAEAERTVSAASQEFGAGQARITAVRLSADGTADPEVLQAGQQVELAVTIAATGEIAKPLVGFILKNRVGIEVLVCNNLALGRGLAPLGPSESSELVYAFRWPKLRPGSYSFTVAVADGEIAGHQQQHWIHDAVVIENLDDDVFSGILGLEEVGLRETRTETPNTTGTD